MPSTFQTCLLVSALASFTNAQLFLNLETGDFELERNNDVEHQDHHTQDEHLQHELDHLEKEHIEHE